MLSMPNLHNVVLVVCHVVLVVVVAVALVVATRCGLRWCAVGQPKRWHLMNCFEMDLIHLTVAVAVAVAMAQPSVFWIALAATAGAPTAAYNLYGVNHIGGYIHTYVAGLSQQKPRAKWATAHSRWIWGEAKMQSHGQGLNEKWHRCWGLCVDSRRKFSTFDLEEYIFQ